jgi:hypothetical protein
MHVKTGNEGFRSWITSASCVSSGFVPASVPKSRCDLGFQGAPRRRGYAGGGGNDHLRAQNLGMIARCEFCGGVQSDAIAVRKVADADLSFAQPPV